MLNFVEEQIGAANIKVIGVGGGGNNAINVMINPTQVINLNGATENEVIPSTLKAIIFLSGYFESPASRALRS